MQSEWYQPSLNRLHWKFEKNQVKMKFFVVCLLTVGAITTSNAYMSPEIKAKITEVFMRCIDQEGASMDQLKELYTTDSPAAPAKCAVACIQETDGFLKDGKFDSEAGLKTLKTAFNPTGDEFEKMKQAYAECEGFGNGAERCDGAFQRMKCLRDTAQKLGLPIFKLE